MNYLEVIVWLFIRLLVYWFVEISQWKWKLRRSTWKENTVSLQNHDLLSVVDEVSNFCLWMVLMWCCRINRYTKQKATENGANYKCRYIKRKKKTPTKKASFSFKTTKFYMQKQLLQKDKLCCKFPYLLDVQKWVRTIF